MATLRWYFKARISDWEVGHGALIPVMEEIPDKENAEPISFMLGARKATVYPAGNGFSTYFDITGEVEEIIEVAHRQIPAHPLVRKVKGGTDHVSLRSEFYSREARISGYYEEDCGEHSESPNGTVCAWLDEEKPNSYRLRIVAPGYVMAEIMHGMIREGSVFPKTRWNRPQVQKSINKSLWDLYRNPRND